MSLQQNGNEIYFSSPYECKKLTSQYELLLNEQWITPLDDGRVVLNNEFMRIMNLFDKIILTWAKSDNASEIFYSDLYKVEDLKQCDYIEQFHPHCLFTSVSSGIVYDENRFTNLGYINNPAICMHSYIQNRDSIINENQPLVITSKGKCKRKETKGYTPLERLLDFTMREIIFIGAENYVLLKRNEYMDRSKDMVDCLKLAGNIKVSNDPFFKKEDENKAEFQRKFKLKYELNLENGDNGNEIAVGSFNYHGINFSKSYNINLNNKFAHTGCVAFGLERLAFTFITQVGLSECYNSLKTYFEEIKNARYESI